MEIRCLVMDDEPIALEKMRSYVDKIPYLQLVAACSNPLEAMKVLSEESVDVIFTDINMQGLNGLDFVESLSKAPMIVFITSYSEYAVESYKVGAVDYIVKPYGLKEFQRAAERVKTQYELLAGSAAAGNSLPATGASAGNGSIFIRTDYKWVRVNSDDIRYIQGLSDYLRISLQGDAEPVVTYATFANMKSCLPPNFIQVHRSWVVNVNHIREIANSRIVMDKDVYIPVGDSYKGELMEYLQNCSVGKSGARMKF